MTELRGVIPITAPPFADGRVDEDSIVTLVEFEARCGVHGLNVLGMTGVAVPDIYSCASAGGAPAPRQPAAHTASSRSTTWPATCRAPPRCTTATLPI